MLRTFFPFGSALVLVAACAGSDEGDTNESALAPSCAPTEATCPAPSASAPGATSTASGEDVTDEPTPEQEPEPVPTDPIPPVPAAPGSMGGASGEDPTDPVGGAPATGEPEFGPSLEPEGFGEPEPSEPEPGEPEPGEPEPAPEPAMSEPEPETPEPETSEPEPETPSDGDAGAPSGDSLVPDIEFCAAVADWEPEWSQWEDEVLLLVNENRAQGADCGGEGSFAPAEPLSMDPLLRCTARVHSLDMYERMFFDHTNPDGDGPGERLDAAGYAGFTWGENIAQGYPSPEDVVSGWMDSDGHCSNIMGENFTLLGVGYFAGDTETRFSMYQHYWTQNFGAEQRDFGGGF